MRCVTDVSLEFSYPLTHGARDLGNSLRPENENCDCQNHQQVWETQVLKHGAAHLG